MTGIICFFSSVVMIIGYLIGGVDGIVLIFLGGFLCLITLGSAVVGEDLGGVLGMLEGGIVGFVLGNHIIEGPGTGPLGTPIGMGGEPEGMIVGVIGALVGALLGTMFGGFIGGWSEKKKEDLDGKIEDLHDKRRKLSSMIQSVEEELEELEEKDIKTPELKKRLEQIKDVSFPKAKGSSSVEKKRTAYRELIQECSEIKRDIDERLGARSTEKGKISEESDIGEGMDKEDELLGYDKG